MASSENILGIPYIEIRTLHRNRVFLLRDDKYERGENMNRNEAPKRSNPMSINIFYSQGKSMRKGIGRLGNAGRTKELLVHSNQLGGNNHILDADLRNLILGEQKIRLITGHLYGKVLFRILNSPVFLICHAPTK